MTFEKYNEAVKGFAVYPHKNVNLLYPAMGIAGEAGELLDKVKKHWRNKGTTILNRHNLTPEELAELSKEIGDVLWYLNAMCNELDTSLDAVAVGNYEKLKDRAKRNVIKGHGDAR